MPTGDIWTLGPLRQVIVVGLVVLTNKDCYRMYCVTSIFKKSIKIDSSCIQNLNIYLFLDSNSTEHTMCKIKVKVVECKGNENSLRKRSKHNFGMLFHGVMFPLMVAPNKLPLLKTNKKQKTKQNKTKTKTKTKKQFDKRLYAKVSWFRLSDVLFTIHHRIILLILWSFAKQICISSFKLFFLSFFLFFSKSFMI